MGQCWHAYPDLILARILRFWEVGFPLYGKFKLLFLELPIPDILLNVFLAIAVDNLADGDNINTSKEEGHKEK